MPRATADRHRCSWQLPDPDDAWNQVSLGRIGDALAALGRKAGLTDEDMAAIDRARDRAPAKPMTFE